MDGRVKDKKITIKDYIVVISLFIITGTLIVVLANYYRDYRTYYRRIPVISGYVNEVSEDELDNYLLENNDTFIYIGKADDTNCRKLEKSLKDFIKKYNLKDKTIYINISKVRNEKDFINRLNNKYAGIKLVNDYPSFIIVLNNRIIDLVSKEGNQNVTVNDIKELLDSYEMIGD